MGHRGRIMETVKRKWGDHISQTSRGKKSKNEERKL